MFNAKKSKCSIFEPTSKLIVVQDKSLFFTLEVMQLGWLTNGLILITLLTRWLTNGLILITLLTIVLMMVLIFHLGVNQWGEINNVLCYFNLVVLCIS